MKDDENIKLAFFLNLSFSLFELIGGIFTNSISILSDSIHDFGDSLSIGISYFLEKISNKKSDDKYTFGYKRYSTLGALITSIILIIGSIIVIVGALGRLILPVDINDTGMFLFAIFGVLINGYAVYRTSKSSSLNTKSVNLHMLEDVLGWLAVLAGSLMIKITGWNFIDPLLSIGIALFILANAFKNTYKIIGILMDKKPDAIETEKLKEEINKITGVKDIHHIHIWTLDGNDIFITMHILVDKHITKKNYEGLKENIRKELSNYNINHSNLEIEYEICNNNKCQ